MEEENKQEEVTQAIEATDALVESAREAVDWNDSEARKAYVARKARERTARLRALGLNARGKPLKDRHKNRDNEKQKRYQHNFAARHKAARERLGLTIMEFNKLPPATRLAEYNKLKGKAVNPKLERNRALKREWYQQNKDKVMAARRSKTVSNGPTPARVERDVRFCPHCGWNIDATRKAQAFVDGRVS
jgi:hypothetical protein